MEKVIAAGDVHDSAGGFRTLFTLSTLWRRMMPGRRSPQQRNKQAWKACMPKACCPRSVYLPILFTRYRVVLGLEDHVPFALPTEEFRGHVTGFRFICWDIHPCVRGSLCRGSLWTTVGQNAWRLFSPYASHVGVDQPPGQVPGMHRAVRRSQGRDRGRIAARCP